MNGLVNSALGDGIAGKASLTAFIASLTPITSSAVCVSAFVITPSEEMVSAKAERGEEVEGLKMGLRMTGVWGGAAGNLGGTGAGTTFKQR